MSQSFPGTIDPTSTSGTSLATIISSWAAAENTLNSGASQPSYRVPGTLWLDTTTAANTILKIYDGTVWINLGFINATAHTTAKPLVTAFHNADQAAANGTQTLLALNTESIDVGNQFASNTFTCVYPGIYCVSIAGQFACTGGVFSSGAGNYLLATTAGGGGLFNRATMGTGSTTIFINGTMCLPLSVGDTVRLASLLTFTAGTAVSVANTAVLNIALIS